MALPDLRREIGSMCGGGHGHLPHELPRPPGRSPEVDRAPGSLQNLKHAIASFMSNIDFLIQASPMLALQQHASRMTEAQLDGYCRTRTRDVLKIAAALLTPAQLELCSQKDPHAAVEFASDLLTSDQISRCAKTAPAKALMFAHHRMTPEQIVTASESAMGKLRTVMGTKPEHPVVDALNKVRDHLPEKLQVSIDRALRKRGDDRHLPQQGASDDRVSGEEILALDNDQLNARALTAPFDVLLHAGHRMNPDQIVKAAGRCGSQLRSILSSDPTHPLVMTLAAVAPRLNAPTRKAVRDAFIESTSTPQPKEHD